MEKHVVLVSRIWNNPNIAISVTDEDLKIQMALPAFIDALAAQVGNPALLLTNAALVAKLTIAAEQVVRAMKDETARVM